MKNILLMIIATIPLQIIAQPKKRVSVRDFNSFSDYGLFSKYRDSLNTLNKVKLDYEYLDEFKKIIASRDSLTAINKKIYEEKKINDYSEGTNQKKFYGTYYLSKTTGTKYDSYEATLYFTESGISIISKNKHTDDIRVYFDYDLKDQLTNLEFNEGIFYIRRDDQFGVLTIKDDIVTLNIHKETPLVFRIKKYIK